MSLMTDSYKVTSSNLQRGLSPRQELLCASEHLCVCFVHGCAHMGVNFIFYMGANGSIQTLFSNLQQLIPIRLLAAIHPISRHSSQGNRRALNSLDFPWQVCPQLFRLAPPTHSGTLHTMSLHCFPQIISQPSPGNQDSHIQILLCATAYRTITLPLHAFFFY